MSQSIYYKTGSKLSKRCIKSKSFDSLYRNMQRKRYTELNVDKWCRIQVLRAQWQNSGIELNINSLSHYNYNHVIILMVKMCCIFTNVMTKRSISEADLINMIMECVHALTQCSIPHFHRFVWRTSNTTHHLTLSHLHYVSTFINAKPSLASLHCTIFWLVQNWRKNLAVNRSTWTKTCVNGSIGVYKLVRHDHSWDSNIDKAAFL